MLIITATTLFIACFISIGLLLVYITTSSLLVSVILIVFLSMTALLFLITIFLLYSMIRATISAAPYANTPHHQVDKIIKLANIKLDQTLLDMGSGDGRIVLAAAKAGAKAIGIESQTHLIWQSNYKKYKQKITNATFVKANLWDYNLKDIDILTLFFIPHRMEKLKNKIKKEMKPGSKVISYDFTFTNWPEQTKDGKINIYQNK